MTAEASAVSQSPVLMTAEASAVSQSPVLMTAEASAALTTAADLSSTVY
jgi:hypothetical protein